MTGSFRELKTYQLAFEAARCIRLISMKFPKEETYSLTDQIRRSSRSVCVNIDEGYRKRIYPKHFTSKMTDADSEATETSIWLDFALDCEYIDENSHRELQEKYNQIGRMLNSMAQHPEKFSPKNKPLLLLLTATNSGMKITEHIQNAKGKTLFSFELIPPLKGQSIQGIYNAIDPLMEFKPPFIDVTSLREDFIYKQHVNGLLEKLSYRKRPGTIAICAAIMNKYKVDTVPHLLCGGFTRDETENGLVDLQFLGIENVLVLRGDARRGDASFVPTPNGHCYATDLLDQVVNMNNGIYLHENKDENLRTDFCIGVAGYPEKHFEAPNLKSDFKYLKQKIDMGAKFVVTQMFFDNQKYFDFVNSCRENGINVPIIPGLKPITTSRQLVSLAKTFFIDMPEYLVDLVTGCKSEKEVREAGIEWTINQCKELIKFGVPVLHFYTMSNAGPTKRIAEAIF